MDFYYNHNICYCFNDLGRVIIRADVCTGQNNGYLDTFKEGSLVAITLNLPKRMLSVKVDNGEDKIAVFNIENDADVKFIFVVQLQHAGDSITLTDFSVS